MGLKVFTFKGQYLQNGWRYELQTLVKSLHHNGLSVSIFEHTYAYTMERQCYTNSTELDGNILRPYMFTWTDNSQAQTRIHRS